MHVDLTDDEAGFLALHITNAQIDSHHEDAISLTQLIEEILTVIKYTLRINFAENDIYFQRFITHLKFLQKESSKITQLKNLQIKLRTNYFYSSRISTPRLLRQQKRLLNY